MTFQSPMQSSRAAAAHGLRVLVVDDERDTVDTLTEILCDEGHRVSALYSGRDVLTAALLLQPDALICDLAIPGLSGYAVAQAMRYAFVPARLPVMIAISGCWKQTPDRLVAELVGFDHHLLKPCDSAQLLALLAGLQPRRIPS